MNNHLSQDQFARCVSNAPGMVELEHLRRCSECTKELEKFQRSLSRFRNAVRHGIDRRVAVHAPRIKDIRSAPAHVSTWRWAMIAAAVVAFVLPYFVIRHQPSQQTSGVSITEPSPDVVMNRVMLHLSRTVPAPMEPVMWMIPSDEPTTQSGGRQ